MIAPDDCLTIARPRRFPYLSLAAIDTHQASIKPESPFSLQERWRSYAHLVVHDNVEIPPESCAVPQHFEFLATDASDPRRKFVSSLCGALGESGNIVVYNAQFESQRLSELAAWLPEFADQIKKIQARLWDLLPVIRNHVYHPTFAGSYSLKSVLPALVPELTYDGMTVSNGQDAGVAWESLVRANLEQCERKKLEDALRAYCGLDTLALLKLLENLRLVQTDPSGSEKLNAR